MGRPSPRRVVRTAAALVLLTGAAARPPAAHAQTTIDYSGSLQLVRGTYGLADPVHGGYLLNGIDARMGPVALSAHLPLVAQDAPIVAYAGGDPLPAGGGHAGSPLGRHAGRRAHRPPSSSSGAFATGVGDPVLGLRVEAYRGPWTVRALELGVRLKAPVADSAAGFGTGRWDVGADASLTIAAGAGYVFVDGGYWRLGDPIGAELLDPIVFGVGVGQAVSDGGSWSVLASLSGSTEIIEAMGPAVSLGAGAGRRLGDGGRDVSFGAEIGLTPAAADLTVHVGWRMRLWSTGRTARRHAENR